MSYHRACCCGRCVYSGVNCSNCVTGKTPTQFTVVFSGIDLGGAACNALGVALSVKNVSCSINGAHILTQVNGDPCLWELVITDDVTYDRYATADCTGAATAITEDLEIQLRRNGSTWSLSASSESAGTVPVPVYAIYADTIAEASANACDTIDPSTNDYTAFNGNIGKDGSATITCV